MTSFKKYAVMPQSGFVQAKPAISVALHEPNARVHGLAHDVSAKARTNAAERARLLEQMGKMHR